MAKSKKEYCIYKVTPGCEEITSWADKTKDNPDGKYELATCSQEALKHLYEDLGNHTEIQKFSYDKGTYDALMKQKAKEEKEKPKEKQGDSAK